MTGIDRRSWLAALAAAPLFVRHARAAEVPRFALGVASGQPQALQGVADRRVPGVVVLGGDVHANYVADLRLDFDDPRGALLASEFCGTSISSLGPAQSDVDAARPFNPHVRYARADQRGYMRFRLDARQLQAEIKVVDNARRADSGIGTAARIVVAAGRPGIEPG